MQLMLRVQSVPAANRTCGVCAAPGVAVRSAARAAAAAAAGHVLMQPTLRHQWSMVNQFANASSEDVDCCAPRGCRVARRAPQPLSIGLDNQEEAKWEPSTSTSS